MNQATRCRYDEENDGWIYGLIDRIIADLTSFVK